jgi:hypothetical protein
LGFDGRNEKCGSGGGGVEELRSKVEGEASGHEEGVKIFLGK